MLRSLHSNGDCRAQKAKWNDVNQKDRRTKFGGWRMREARRDVTLCRILSNLSLSLSFLLHADDDIVLLLSVCLVAATPTPRCICCCCY